MSRSVLTRIVDLKLDIKATQSQTFLCLLLQPTISHKEETWNEDEHPVEVAPFTATTGPTLSVVEDGTAIDFFYLMFAEALIEQIVLEMNSYARECIAIKPDPEWFNTTLAELKAFLGLHVLFGIKQLLATRLYWSSDPLIGVTALQEVMSRNRLDKLSQYLHVNNNANQVLRENPARDKLFKFVC